MADVTSTARLIVTVEGEGKIAALAAQLKALGAAGGTRKLGVSTGGSLAAQMAATKLATKSAIKQSLAPVIAAQAITAKAMAPVAAQQKTIAKTIAPLVASQAVTGKLMGPIVGQQASLAKSVAPLMAAQAVTGKMVKAWTAGVAGAAVGGAMTLPTTAAATTAAAPAAMRAAATTAAKVAATTAAATTAARMARLAAPIAASEADEAAKTGITERYIRSVQRRGGGSAEEIRARFAEPKPSPLVPPKPPKPPRGGAKVAAVAGLAEGAEAGAGVTAARAGLIGLGAAGAAASLGVAAAVGSFGALLTIMKTGFGAASQHAKDTIKFAGEAKRAGLTLDEVQERRIAGERILGEQYESVEKRLPKLLTSRNKQMRAALAGLGLSPEDVSKFEKAGKRLDPLDVIEKMQTKREALEDKLAKASTAKRKAEAEAALRSFDDKVTKFLGKEAADKIAAGRAKETRQAIEDAKRVTAQGPVESQERQIANAKALGREQDLIARNAAAQSSRIGSGMSESISTALNTFRTKFQETMGPGTADVIANIGRIGFEGLNAGLTSLATSAPGAKTAIDNLATTLSTMKFDDLGATLGEGIRSALDNAFKQGAADFSPDSSFVDSVVKNWQILKDKLAAMVAPPEKPSEDEAAKVAKRDAELREQSAAQNAAEAAAKIRSESTEAAREQRAKEIRMQEQPEERPSQKIKDVFDQLSQMENQIKVNIDPAAAANFATAATQGISEAGATGGGNFSTAVQSGITTAGSTGGAAFSTAAGSGLSAAGSAAGGAFNSAVNASSIGSQIGAAAAAAISAAKVNVNVNANVSGAAVGGGGRGGSPSTGPDTPSGGGGD